MNYKEQLEKLINRFNTDGMYGTTKFGDDLRTLINSIDKPSTLEVKDTLRIEIATKIYCEVFQLVGFKGMTNEEVIDYCYNRADAIIERGKAKL